MSKAFLFLRNMESKEIKLNVQLTEKDYLTFQKDHIKNQTGFLKPKALWIYSGILLVLILFVNRENLLDTGFLGINFTFLIPLIPIGLLILFKCIFSILIFSMKSRVKSSFESDPTINNPMEIIINNEGLTVNAYRANTNPLWKDIYRYLITKDTFYIYTSEVKSIIIPKRLLENTNDIDTLTDLLKNNVDFSGYKRQSTNGNYIKWGIRAVGILCFVFL